MFHGSFLFIFHSYDVRSLDHMRKLLDRRRLEYIKLLTIGGQKKLISCKRAVDIPRITLLCLRISHKTGLRTLDLGRKYATMVSSFTTGHGKTGEENVMFKLAVLQYALMPRPQQCFCGPNDGATSGPVA